MSNNSFKTLVQQRAQELGFSKIRFTKPKYLDNHALLFKKWLSNNYHGTMDWLIESFEERTDPFKVFADVKTVIVVALNYFVEKHYNTEKKLGKISRYAWGEDYHKVVKKKLKYLMDYLKFLDKSLEYRFYVDTGPIMEKAWAQISGIGWLGKNATIITPEYGSWVFLGVILLNRDIENDQAIKNRCGTCLKCMRACPTGAIVAPYILDSNLCISYLTIEHKGVDDNFLPDRLNGWLFGCDICQEVCPWNKKFSKETSIIEFFPREDMLNLDLSELENITVEKFNRLYKNSPIKRIKHQKFLKNLQIIKKESTNGIKAS